MNTVNNALETLAVLRLRIGAKLEKEGFRPATGITEQLIAQYSLAAAMIMQAQAMEIHTDRVMSGE
jgi:hypothetical protein